MKNPVQTSYCILFGYFAKLKRHKISALILSLVGLTYFSPAQSTWNGSASTDWNTADNWSAGVPSGVDAIINTITPNICTITATLSASPVDFRVGTGGTGQVNHISGNAFTGNGNWLFLGYSGGNATYNLCDTTTTGGTFTSFGEGSGSFYVGGISNPNGELHAGLDPGTISTLNINSSGTFAAGALYFSGNGPAGTSIFNLDNGTVTSSGDCWFGGSDWGPGTAGFLNMSGGTLTANDVIFSRGANNTTSITGTGNITGGTLNALTWLTLGFCGTSASVGTVTNSGGTINVNTAGGGNMEMTTWDTAGALYVQNFGALNLCNSAYMGFGNGGNNAGIATFNQNGGTVTFYSDNGTAVGGTGYLVLGRNPGWAHDSGNYTYNLNGGTLTVPQIQQEAGSSSGTFNFNGGTLKPTASNATFMQGLSGVYVQSGGAIIDTTNFNITIVQNLQDGGGGLTKLGAGTLTLSGANTYTGNTTVNAGTLEIVSASVATNSTVSIATGAKLQLDFATTNQIGALVLNGVTQSPGIYNSTTTPANISGAGSLVVPGSGTGTFTNMPGITHFALNGGNVVITGTNGQEGDAYYLLASTNLALPLNQWHTVATNVLSAGNFTYTGSNVVTAGNNQQFYILSSTNYNH